MAASTTWVRVSVRATLVALAFAAGTAWPATVARAQAMPDHADSPTHLGAPTPRPASAATDGDEWADVSEAYDSPSAEPAEDTASSGPSIALVATGIVVFGASWLAAVVGFFVSIDCTSGGGPYVAVDCDSASAWLFAPVVGPWAAALDSHPGSEASIPLLLVDGVLQLAGAALVVGGLVHRPDERARARGVFPTVGLGGAGVAGTF